MQKDPDWNARPEIKNVNGAPTGAGFNWSGLASAIPATIGAATDISNSFIYDKGVNELLAESGERDADAMGVGYRW